MRQRKNACAALQRQAECNDSHACLRTPMTHTHAYQSSYSKWFLYLGKEVATLLLPTS